MFKVFGKTGIESNYSISTNALFSSDGWTVYPLKHKVTKKQCSVWIFDKKKLEAKLTKLGVISGRGDRSMVMEECCDIMRDYVANLVKLKHPSFLHVLEPLEDHKSRSIFVTEYVLNNLHKIDKKELDEIMITKGLLQVSNGVKFLHENLQSVHLNLQPSTIFINENFDWKISGLNFMEPIESGSGEINTFDPRMPNFVNVNFKFSSPIFILQHQLNFSNDLFSIGCLIYYLFNSQAQSSPFIINCENNDLSEYERDVKKLTASLQRQNQATFRNIPDNFVNSLLVLLNYSQSQWDINQFIDSDVFNNELIKVLNFFDTFLSQDLNDQFKILNNFKMMSSRFPKKLLLNKFLPTLLDLLESYTKDSKRKISTEEEAMIVLIIENIFIISQPLSQLTFVEKIFPKLNQTIQTQGLINGKIAIITNLKLVESKIGGKDEVFSNFLITIFKNAMSTQDLNQQFLNFQEKVLTNLDIFVRFQNYNNISNVIFPSICTLFAQTTSLKIKNLTIDSFILLLTNKENSLDNFTITEKLLPLLHNTSAKNFKNTEFLSKVISLYGQIFDKLSIKHDSTNLEVIMEQIFFQLWKLLKYTNTRNLNQYLLTIVNKIEKFLIEKNSENLTVEPQVTQVSEPEEPSFDSFQTQPIKATNITNSIQSNESLKPNRLHLNSKPRTSHDWGGITARTPQISLSTLQPNSVSSFGSSGVLKPNAPVSRSVPMNSIQNSSQNVSLNSTPSAQRIPMNTLQSSSQPLHITPQPLNSHVTPMNTVNSFQQPLTMQTNTIQNNVVSVLPLQPTSNLPPGFSMEVIQPLKKTSQSPNPQGINWQVHNNDSLI